MKEQNVIEVHNVSKFFKSYSERPHQLKELVLLSDWKKNNGRREILKDISFEIRTGEAVALIGKNGCGKSTTLKLLSKIIRPDNGSIELKGRVASLIELGAGFHPDMTGRENIYINASIFGLNAKEVDKRIRSIIEFSELEDFIDEPVRTYSSGMYLRLAFSVAINVEPDILLIDEILAVGDASFQQKCINWIMGLKEKGVTLVLVSHSMSQIEKICDRAIWIEDGCIKADGMTGKVCNLYLNAVDRKQMEAVRKQTRELEKKASSNTPPAESEQSDGDPYDKERKPEYCLHNNFEKIRRFTKTRSESISIVSLDVEKNTIEIGDKLNFSICVDCKEKIQSVFFRCTVYTQERKPVWTGISEEIGAMELDKQYQIGFCLDTSLMVIGHYSMNIVLFTPDEKGGNLVHDVIWNALFFNIINKEGAYHNLYWNIDAWGNAIYPIIPVTNKKLQTTSQLAEAAGQADSSFQAKSVCTNSPELNKAGKMPVGYEEALNRYILAKWNLEGSTPTLKNILEYHRFSLNILNQKSRLIYISCFLQEKERDLAIIALKDYIRDFNLENIEDLMPVADLAAACGYSNEKIEQSANIYRAFKMYQNSGEFEKYVRGKSLAIVGNSPEIIGSGKGAEIDSRDIVVRMNSFILKEEYFADTGCKTNIFVDNSNNGVIKCSNHRQIEKFEWTFLPYDIEHIFISQFCYNETFLQSWSFIVGNKLTKMISFPAEHSISLKKELRTVSPSAGIIAIWYLYKIRKTISEQEIFGFNSQKRKDGQERSCVKENMDGEIEDLNFFFDTIDQSSFFKSAPIYEVSHNFNEELIFRQKLLGFMNNKH